MDLGEFCRKTEAVEGNLNGKCHMLCFNVLKGGNGEQEEERGGKGRGGRRGR